MSGSGVRKFGEKIKDFGCFVAGLGAALVARAPSRIASGTSPISGAAILGFVCPGTKLPFMAFTLFSFPRSGRFFLKIGVFPR